MRIIADLHIHSKYARGTSKNLDLENVERYGLLKGLGLVGTGDFTHPKWIVELKSKLENKSVVAEEKTDSTALANRTSGTA